MTDSLFAASEGLAASGRIEGRAEEARWSLPAPRPGPVSAAIGPDDVPIATIPAPGRPITVTLHCDEIYTRIPERVR